MKRFLGSITRRERRFAAAGVVITLTLLIPVVATAEPGLIPGTEPGTEQAVDAERGDSCRDMLPAGTPSYVVCRWLTPPQDAAQVATFWTADDGANLERAQPLPAQYVRCNRTTDLSTSRTCKGGETLCKQQPTGWYRCTDQTTGKITYEGYVNGKWVVRSTPPSTAPPSTAAATVTATSTASSSTPVRTIDATAVLPAPPSQPPTTPAASSGSARPTGQSEPPPDGNPATPTLTEAPNPTSPVPTMTSQSPATTPTTTPTVEPTAEPTATATTADAPAAQAIAAAAAVRPRLRVWVETDLADDYTAGDARFTAALDAVIAAARKPGVIGVKFADNLGYTGFTSPGDVTRFLTRAGGALRAALPGKRLSIGVVVPELGCGSAKACTQAMRAKAPLATKENVTRYLKARAADRVEISTGLFGRTYRRHHVPDPKTGKPTSITPALAARAQWMSIRALEWDTLAQIGAREYGLAHTGDTSVWDQAAATAQIDARIGTAIALGVPTITLWGHQAIDDNQTYRLLDAGLTPNALWTTLTRQGLRGRLAVIIDATSTERGITADLTELAKAVSEVFLLL
ncbi:hypothetical protein ACU635_60680 [[Actinomadura] parvosata]|uniref:hypothetical protein n=1 Tax=[Actinomadura] parvosata TaxID=1955412 RepID=UPI00406C95C9